MIRILGSVLNVSFQTELLIMTLLGLANSTLDWKPFELVTQLSAIDALHFPARGDVEISGNFISWIKKLLTLTVVVQFCCSLLNPLAYLLKLYPIITWSRADVLLPWLTIHALNTILPKLMSLVLAFVFYFESMISTVSLLEFLLVETINLVIAWCNWYLFFDFYMDLRSLEKKRQLIIRDKVHRKLHESRKPSHTHSSSIPNLKEEIRASSSELRPVRSLGGLTEEMNRSVKNSFSSMLTDGTLTPAEKTIKILNLTDKELQSARIRKGSLNKVLSNANTADVELVDLASPDDLSSASVDNTDESVIIVYDSQDEKELEKILAPVEESEHEGRDLRRKKMSPITDEELLMELLDVDTLIDEGSMKVDLLEKEQALENRKLDSSQVEEKKLSESKKSSLVEEEKLSEIKKSILVEEERLSEIKKSSLVEEERLSEIEKSSLVEEEKLSEIEKSSLVEEKRLSEIKKSRLAEEEKLKNKRRRSSREEELFKIKQFEVAREEKLFKHQRPKLPRNEDEYFPECVCSSSDDDDDDEENDAPAKTRPQNFLIPLPVEVDTIRKEHLNRKELYYAQRKKTKNKSVQTVDYPEIPFKTLLLSPSTALVPKGNIQYIKSEEKDLHCLLNENFQLLDKMCRAMNFSNNQSIPNNSLRKWLIFRHQLESSLDQNAFLKKNGSVIELMNPKPIGYFNVKDKNTQTEATLKAKKRHKEKRGTLLHYPKSEVIESKWNYVESFPGTSADMIGKSLRQVDKSVESSKISDVSDDKIHHFINIVNFSKTSSNSRSPAAKKVTKPATCDNREKTSISILKTKVPVKYSELECVSGQKDKDLRNLKAYNKLTLEQDKRDLIQKKKKSKMTSYKNAVTELILQNSDVVPNRPVKVDHRTCRSNQLRLQNTAHLPKARNRNAKQLFRYNEKLFDQPLEAEGISENPKDKYLEMESYRDKRAPTVDITELSVCRSDTNISTQGHLRKAGEGLEQIDWLDPSSHSTARFKSPQVAVTAEADEPRSSVIVDDETVSMLKCAFSFSDESERGFQLGPEMREPYPIFQVVALTMAEIFKATEWRNFEESLPENSNDIPVADVIFCEAQLDCDEGDEVVDLLNELINAGEEEPEQRKFLSVSLLEQLQELLKSSREALSEVENYQSQNELENRFHFFDNLCMKDCNMVDDITPGETCVYPVNEQIFSNPLNEPKESFSNSNNQKSELPSKTAFQSKAISCVSGNSRISPPESKRDSTRPRAKAHRSRTHETKFENKVQKHHCRKGGLSSGNVMEFDSKGRALNSMSCPSDEAISEPEERSTVELIETFNSFCDKFMESEAGDLELAKDLKTLAKSDKFLKFMSLFEEDDLKTFKEKINNEENEMELSSSDFAIGETVRDTFVDLGMEKQSISVKAKKGNQDFDLANAFSEKNFDLPSSDAGMTYSQKLKNYKQYLESDDTKHRILNWNESVNSIDSLDYPKNRKVEETRSFSNNSDIEEFPVN